MPDPLGTEFGIIADEAAYGRDVSESLKAFAERMDMQDLRFLAVAVSIQQQSGGNLAEILEGLAKVIRSRFKSSAGSTRSPPRRNGRACSCRGSRSAPWSMIQVLQANYYDGVKDTPVFIPACLVVGTFLVINVIFMKMMVNIKV